MAQFTIKVERSFLRDGLEIFEFSVPAINERLARRGAIRQATIKGMENPEIEDIENIGSSGVPGRDLFIVTVAGER